MEKQKVDDKSKGAEQKKAPSLSELRARPSARHANVSIPQARLRRVRAGY